MEIITSETELAKAGFYWREIDGVRALICGPLEQDGFVNGFLTRLGGVSPMTHDSLNLAGFNEDTAENILENRRRFLKLFSGNWILTGCWQVHGAEVHLVKDEADAQPVPGVLGDGSYCDALVSDAARVLLGVKTADCVPIVIADPKTGAFAAVHAGWRGTLGRITESVLLDMKDEHGVDPKSCLVALGPAACVDCYEVGEDVASDFQKEFSNSQEFLKPGKTGRFHLDVRQANVVQLLGGGVPLPSIHLCSYCTMHQNDLFFSYRMEGKASPENFGRLLSVIGRRGQVSPFTQLGQPGER